MLSAASPVFTGLAKNRVVKMTRFCELMVKKSH